MASRISARDLDSWKLEAGSWKLEEEIPALGSRLSASVALG
jgi:hypothetical protein